MQKVKTISKLLGLKQEELAMLLKVNKSQLGMFETGKRGLPTTALLLLAPMLQFVQEESWISGSAEMLKLQTELQKKVVEQLLKDNHYKQKLLERKLEIAEKKYHSTITAVKLMRFLEKEAMKKEVPANDFVKTIEARVVKELEQNSLEVVVKLQIQKEVLLAEERMLLEKLS